MERKKEGHLAKEGTGGMKLTDSGISFITADMNLKDKWSIIERLILDYAKLHPDEIQAMMDYVKDEKDEQRNQHASSKDKTIRRLIALPVGLKVLIARNFPEMNSKDKDIRTEFYQEFARRFPAFAIAEKI